MARKNADLQAMPDFVSGVSLDWLEGTVFRIEAKARKPDIPGGGFDDEGNPRRLSDQEWKLWKAGHLSPVDFLGPLADKNEVAQLVGLRPDAFAKADRGLLGYKTRWTCDGVTILEDGTASMGCHLVITGGVVRHLPYSPVQIIRNVIANGGKFSRIDGAIDDFDGLLPLEKMIERAWAGGIAGRLHDFNIIAGGKCSTGMKTGETLYIGNRESQVSFRCYNKKLEQKFKKKIPEKFLPAGDWIRLEVEMKGDAAQNFALAVAKCEPGRDDEHVAACVLGVIKNYLNFKEPKPGSNEQKKSRWQVCNWWESFIRDAEKLKVSKMLREPTVEKRLRWFRKQCLTTFGVAGVALGERALAELYKEGLTKLEEKPALKKDAEKIREKIREEDERWKKANEK